MEGPAGPLELDDEKLDAKLKEQGEARVGRGFLFEVWGFRVLGFK